MTTGLLRVSKNEHNTESNQGVVHLLEARIRSITLQYKIITTLEKSAQLRMQIGRLKVTFKLMKIETVITLVRILTTKNKLFKT
jgi:spore coat polysaccharide biosynthesis protein SpsF (cytidylyltransferase family)